MGSEVGAIEPKSRAGVRAVPIVGALRSHLVARRLHRGSAAGLFFGNASGGPFNPNTINKRAAKAWSLAQAKLRESIRPELSCQSSCTSAATLAPAFSSLPA